MAGLTCGDGRYWPRSGARAFLMAPCLQGQYRQSAQVRGTWRLDAPDSRTMLTPGRSLSSLASLQPRRLSGVFDAALVNRDTTSAIRQRVATVAGYVDVRRTRRRGLDSRRPSPGPPDDLAFVR